LVALFKRAITLSIAQLLFSKEGLSNCCFGHSFPKSNQKRDCSITLLKKAIEQLRDQKGANYQKKFNK